MRIKEFLGGELQAAVSRSPFGVTEGWMVYSDDSVLASAMTLKGSRDASKLLKGFSVLCSCCVIFVS